MAYMIASEHPAPSMKPKKYPIMMFMNDMVVPPQ
jgi:hypothetical protein